MDDSLRENEIYLGFEYDGPHGPISTFHFALLTQAMQARLEGISSIKLYEYEPHTWKAVFYKDFAEGECPFPEEEINALCAAQNVTLFRE